MRSRRLKRSSLALVFLSALAVAMWLGCSASSSSPGTTTPPPSDAGSTTTDDGGTTAVPNDAGGCIGADAGVLALTSDNKPISFVVAAPDPVTGDWQGTGGYVAQVFSTATGAWQANLLHGFDVPNDMPAAVLAGTPTSCTSMSFTGGGWTATIQNGHFTGQNGADSFDLQHVLRASPTLGAPPPAGATVLFDGTSFDAWGTIAGQNWLAVGDASAWDLVDGSLGGAMEVVPGTASIVTKQSFGDCTIHAEFRTLGTPTHSGVFPEARYQTTILQTYGVYSGSITGNFGNQPLPMNVVNPTIHAERAPLEWQTLDIDFQAPRSATMPGAATVMLNGVKIFDQFPLSTTSGAAGKFGESPTGPLLLEYHGMPLQYRNIWVVPAGQ
jgi:hypothetical protein